MSPMNRVEAIGIFASIAIMALALVAIRFSTDTTSVLSTTEGESQGAVVVASDNGDGTGLATALEDASSIGGELLDLVVTDVVVGDGRVAKEGDTLTVHYVGRTRNGLEFDNSYNRGAPFSLTLGEGRVIQGWEKGLIGMQAGGKRVLVIPPEMAYGNRQVGPIAPNSILVFVVELLAID